MLIILCGACSTPPSRIVNTQPINPTNNIIYKMITQLKQMQTDMQQMRGVIEEQSQSIVRLKKRQTNIYTDINLRLQTLTSRITPSKQVSGERASKSASQH